MGFCNCSMFYCTFLYVPSSFAIILMGKSGLVSLLSLSSWRLVIVVWLFLAVPWVSLKFLIVVFPDHTHLLFFVVFPNTMSPGEGKQGGTDDDHTWVEELSNHRDAERYMVERLR